MLINFMASFFMNNPERSIAVNPESESKLREELLSEGFIFVPKTNSQDIPIVTADGIISLAEAYKIPKRLQSNFVSLLSRKSKYLYGETIIDPFKNTTERMLYRTRCEENYGDTFKKLNDNNQLRPISMSVISTGLQLLSDQFSIIQPEVAKYCDDRVTRLNPVFDHTISRDEVFQSLSNEEKIELVRAMEYEVIDLFKFIFPDIPQKKVKIT